MARGLIAFDRRALGGAAFLVGIDEAGRGCLAGPVVAAAVRCEAAFYATSWCRRHGPRVDDSKRLSPEARAALVGRFAHACREKWIQVGIGVASVGEIADHNIYHATTLAMRRALRQVWADDGPDLWRPGADGGPAAVVLIDGKPIRNFGAAHAGVVGGDARSLAVALASVHAKEHRDALMRELDAALPGYGFAAHKGYGTPQHLEALRALGPSPHHRADFIRGALAGPESAHDPRQGSLF